ncbi:MAG: MarC family protein [Nitrospirota bacterium]
MDIVYSYLLTLIPLMVAIDAPGVMPIFLSMTEGMGTGERRRIARQSVFTAFMVTSLFIFLGTAVFNVLGILVEDFMIAGGILLLAISIADMLIAETKGATGSPDLGIVPLGTPLLAGPATIATSLLLVGSYGYIPVFLSLVLNMLLAWFIFNRAELIIRLIGVSGTRAIARLASLLLAAIAIKMIRTGVTTILKS